MVSVWKESLLHRFRHLPGLDSNDSVRYDFTKHWVNPIMSEIISHCFILNKHLVTFLVSFPSSSSYFVFPFSFLLPFVVHVLVQVKVHLFRTLDMRTTNNSYYCFQQLLVQFFRHWIPHRRFYRKQAAMVKQIKLKLLQSSIWQSDALLRTDGVNCCGMICAVEDAKALTPKLDHDAVFEGGRLGPFVNVFFMEWRSALTKRVCVSILEEESLDLYATVPFMAGVGSEINYYYICSYRSQRWKSESGCR